MTIIARQDNFLSPVYFLKSFAKINLTLSVTGKRDDGYHLLKSIFAYIDLYDVITIQQNSGTSPSLKTTGLFCSHLKNDFDSLDDNLVIRVIRNMYDKYRIPTNFDIILDKRIPVTSGMGGGSSNAAAIIRFLNSYFGMDLSDDELMEIALSVGADVPFFLQNKMAICEGIGEIITPLDIDHDQKIYCVVINFGLKSSTGNVFKKLSKQLNGFDSVKCEYSRDSIRDFSDIVEIVNENGNSLQGPSAFYSPGIQMVIDFLQNSGLSIASGMSGAGPACFGLCYKEADADRLVMLLRNKFGNCFIKKAAILPTIEFEKIASSSMPYYVADEMVINDIISC